MISVSRRSSDSALRPVALQLHRLKRREDSGVGQAIANNLKSITGISSAVGLLLAVLLVPAGFAAKVGKNRQDSLVAGSAAENRIAREVRHRLLLLPYYGVFDNLA